MCIMKLNVLIHYFSVKISASFMLPSKTMRVKKELEGAV